MGNDSAAAVVPDVLVRTVIIVSKHRIDLSKDIKGFFCYFAEHLRVE